MMASDLAEKRHATIDSQSSYTSPTKGATTRTVSEVFNSPTPTIARSRIPSPEASQRTLQYDPNASIALIGMRGSGLSTLAVLASSSLGFRVLDADQYFYKTTGLSRAAYKTAHGISKYRQEELQLMRSMLFDNPTGAIIVCGPGAVEGKGKEWLAEYSKEHLIIYILRDAKEIQQHLRAFDVETIKNLIRRAAPAYRRLSSFEYYNISDTLIRNPSSTPSRGDMSPSALALKNVEEDFVHLIHSIVREDDSSDRYKARHSLSSLPIVSRRFTYVLSIPLTTLSSHMSEFKGVDIEADAIEVTIPISALCKDGKTLGETAEDWISRQVSVVRRNIGLPILYQIENDDTGRPDIDEDQYFALLEHGLRLGPEYLCVDLECNTDRIKTLVASKGQTGVIGHYSVCDPAEDGWDSTKHWAMVQRAQDLGCDILRICQRATSLADNFASQHFIHRVKASQNYSIPVIAYNTGHLGRMSCCFNPILSPVTHPVIRKLGQK